MKFYKRIIFAVILISSVMGAALDAKDLPLPYSLILIAIFSFRLVFIWKWANGLWSTMGYLPALAIVVLLTVAEMFTTAFYLSGHSHAPLAEIFHYWWEYVPSALYRPILPVLVTLFVWRWLFAESRKENAAATSVDA